MKTVWRAKIRSVDVQRVRDSRPDCIGFVHIEEVGGPFAYMECEYEADAVDISLWSLGWRSM